LDDSFCFKILNNCLDPRPSTPSFYESKTCLCLYEDIDDGVIYIDANSDSLTWMFRGDLSNFPQIQFLVRKILGFEDPCYQVIDMVTRAVFLILSIFSDVNQLCHISLVRGIDYLDVRQKYKDIVESENVTQYVIGQWIAFKRVKDRNFSPSEEETKSFDTTIILKSIDDIINRMKVTTFTYTFEEGTRISPMVAEKGDRIFFINASIKTGFARIDTKNMVPDISQKEKVLYCLTMSA